MRKHVWISIALLLAFTLLGLFLVRGKWVGAKFPFRFGLDLVGGTELVYRADTSEITDISGAMQSLKEVIERRIAESNLSGALGALEPVIQTESAGIISGHKDERLIVELPGLTDINQAVTLIGKTPILEFRLVHDKQLISTGLTGRYLNRARVEFSSNSPTAQIALEFNKTGADLFATITREHKGEMLGIILDGTLLEAPVIKDEIRDGKAQITGNFTPEAAKELVRNLNYGALPVPIELATSQTVGATLGAFALNSGVRAGIIGFVILSLFLILWYRLPGLVAVLALVSYIILSLSIFKLIPVTLTTAGIAGFILSIGMAVDANILIFERMKEELKKGKNINDALREGFTRAWLSIRDSNISSIITAVVLFWLGTSAVKGFALTLGLGVLISMFTAITVSRTFLFAIAPKNDINPSTSLGVKRFLFNNGLNK